MSNCATSWTTQVWLSMSGLLILARCSSQILLRWPTKLNPFSKISKFNIVFAIFWSTKISLRCPHEYQSVEKTESSAFIFLIRMCINYSHGRVCCLLCLSRTMHEFWEWFRYKLYFDSNLYECLCNIWIGWFVWVRQTTAESAVKGFLIRDPNFIVFISMKSV